MNGNGWFSSGGGRVGGTPCAGAGAGADTGVVADVMTGEVGGAGASGDAGLGAGGGGNWIIGKGWLVSGGGRVGATPCAQAGVMLESKVPATSGRNRVAQTLFPYSCDNGAAQAGGLPDNSRWLRSRSDRHHRTMSLPLLAGIVFRAVVIVAFVVVGRGFRLVGNVFFRVVGAKEFWFAPVGGERGEHDVDLLAHQARL